MTWGERLALPGPRLKTASMPVFAIVGPRESGPGEREQMLSRAHGILAEHHIDDPVRVDVPDRGSGEDVEGQLRESIHAVVPALQSGSLFGDASGVLIVDAQWLLKAEAEVVADLLSSADPQHVVAVLVAAGSLPAPIARVVKDIGQTITVRKLRERDASEWLAGAARERGLRVDADAAAILLHRFGSNIASMGRALDQLAMDGDVVTANGVQGRFASRPDEPMWHLADAITAGREGDALRRLEDFLEHGHPLVLLSYLEGEVRRRSLAAAAPDIETYAGWVGANASSYPVRKVWEGRSRTRADTLRRSLDAVARADLQLKTAPEATHRITLERLTVALCRWIGR